MKRRRGRKDWKDHKDVEEQDKEKEADKEVMWKEGPQSDCRETKWPPSVHLSLCSSLGVRRDGDFLPVGPLRRVLSQILARLSGTQHNACVSLHTRARTLNIVWVVGQFTAFPQRRLASSSPFSFHPAFPPPFQPWMQFSCRLAPSSAPPAPRFLFNTLCRYHTIPFSLR